VNNDPVNWIDLWGLEEFVFSNSSTFVGGSEAGLVSVTVITNVVVNTDNNQAKVSSLSTKEIYETGDVSSKTRAAITVNGAIFDIGQLSKNNSEYSILPAEMIDLGSTILDLPPGFGNTNIVVTTRTDYVYNPGYGTWAIGSQSVTVPISPNEGKYNASYETWAMDSPPVTVPISPNEGSCNGK
jgi:hypothetical protein